MGCYKDVASNEFKRVTGYICRSCNAGNMPDQTQRPDGYYT